MLVIILAAFLWLMLETNWLTIRLLAGSEFDYHNMPPAPMICQPVKIKPILLLAQYNSLKNWQLRMYGDKALLLCRNCDTKCRLTTEAQFYGWQIPKKTFKLYGQMITLESGCNLAHARMLKDIVRINTAKQPFATYKPEKDAGRFYLDFGKWKAKPLPADYEPTIELIADGKSISYNGDFKPGKIKDWMRQFKTAKVKA